jgi:secreted PhoX family phosphatase
MPLPGAGGASAVEFAPDGGVERAYRILAGTLANCAGGPTPWGTWLSCEEHAQGRVWECDPTGAAAATARPAMGVFSHEAASVDTERECVYLTEDEGDGCFYRFTPTDYPDLSAGLLEVAVVDGSGAVTWVEVPDPAGGASNPTRNQVPAATRFDGGEGTWYDDGIAYFTTKGDGRVWAYHAGPARLDLIYDEAAVGPDAPLSGVDNITVSPAGDIYVCEDGRDHDICLITPGFEVARFLKLHPEVHSGPPEPSPIKGNETVGVVFDPSGERMFFGAQRSFGVGGNEQIPAGVVYEVTGPFRGPSGPGTGGNPPAPVPGAQPRVWVQNRRRARRFLREGLPVRLDLPEPMGVDAVLRASYRGADGRRRWARIGRVSPGVALNGKATIKLDPAGRVKRVLRGRRRVGARLRVVATNGDGQRTVLQRDVVLWNPHPRHPLR